MTPDGIPGAMETPGVHHVVVLISANVEWRLVTQLFFSNASSASLHSVNGLLRDFRSPAPSGGLMTRTTYDSVSVLFFTAGGGKSQQPRQHNS